MTVSLCSLLLLDVYWDLEKYLKHRYVKLKSFLVFWTLLSLIFKLEEFLN